MNAQLRQAIRKILLAGGTMAFSASVLAVVGQQNPPPGPGQVPDYFGVVPNFANSPQPVLATVTITDPNGGSGAVAAATTYDYSTDTMTDTIMDVQVLNGGANYSASTTVTINGGSSVATPAQVVPNITNGAITGFTISNPGKGYSAPIAGTGIRKFVDSLATLDKPNTLGQQMPIGVPDKTTFAGSDYYEIAEVEYDQKMNSDLPPTRLRGYVQIKTGGFTLAGYNGAANKAAYASQYAGYLGPVIVAQKNRPVRVKLVNLLPTGAKGNLPFPVDHTYMGSDGPTDTDNRTSVHLHGGNTPWISDGTARQWVKPAGEAGPNRGESARNVPDMWFDATGNLIGSCAGKTYCTIDGTPAGAKIAGATNDPGAGALTFYYTNEQSARLMFYHDHAEGVTRLNVYAGMAGAYLLQDPTEQGLVANGTLPADMIPLVIQEKTFVPDDTTPVLNFYGPFKSQLNSQDPTWRWGTGKAVSGKMGNGDLWVPHVFMPNQNPGDVTGANAVGRWDYGPWFWPPFAGIQNGPLANPYYDPNCNTTIEYCEGPQIPGVPNGSLQSVMSNGIPGGVPDATKGGAITESPSGTPESFNDTPLVNGTAYPYVNVDPKPYRLRILSVGNDRMLNLSFVVAASKNAPSTSKANAGPTASAPAVLCDGSTAVSPSDCTEVKMVPFDTTQDTFTPFPSHWYTVQKGGVTFDGRPGGVFDPNTRGPAMVQIGTEGGFLSSPVVIKNQPVNYEYNPKNILIGNVKEKALYLGPAERADVLVDFSNFAGSTLVLYNDAPAPMPAWDLRLDYFTGNFDTTDTGGAFSVIPGYGPNSRTLMQFRVSGSGGSHPVDDTGTLDLAKLSAAVQTAFKTSQEPIIVPQSTYNNTYPNQASDALGKDLSRISDTSLTYNPYNFGTGGFDPAVTLEMEPKTIIEDWTTSWGRMNALLGIEVPHTTAINQTSIPQAFVDPPTEIVKITPNDNMVPVSGTLADGTQLWKITHNGVDSHAVHFHLFHVQLVNRVGWDGAIYPPDANELGWKDTVIMNPLSDVIVALRPYQMTSLPFKVPNSHHKPDPAKANAAAVPDAFNLDPMSGNATNVTNLDVNYGWEYLWHCHILGHEENDMMRSIAVAQPPEAPSGLTATTNSAGKIVLTWTDNSMVANSVTIQRSQDNFKTWVVINTVIPECNSQAGCSGSYTDTSAPTTDVSYRLMANNTVGAGDGKLDAPRSPDGSYGAFLPPELAALTPGFTGYSNVTANSNWSNVATRYVIPTAKVSPLSLTFANINTGATSAAQMVTLTNVGVQALTVNKAVTFTGPFARGTTTSAGTCTSGTSGTFTLAANASCTIGVVFKPTAIGSNQAGTLVITDNSGGVANSKQTVTLSGTAAPIAGVSTSALTFTNTTINTTSTAQTFTLSNTGAANLSVSGVSFPTGFIRSGGTCATTATFTVNANASCTIGVAFRPTVAGAATGNLTITSNSNGTAGTAVTVALSGTGVAPTPNASLSTASLSFASTNVGLNSAAQTVTLTNNGSAALAVSGVSFPTGFVRSGGTCATTATFSVAAGANCSIGVAFAPTAAGAASGNLVITDNSGGVTGTTQSVALTGTATAATLTANPDTATATANTTTAQAVTVSVRANDVPVNTGTVAVVGMSKTATATASATVSANNIVLNMTGVGGTASARQASKRGVYTITYSLTNGGVTVQSTATITVN